MERNYYLIGGYDFQPNRDLSISPSVLLKYAESGKFQADITSKIVFQQSYWGGLTYRTGQSIILLLGVSVDKFIFGYAYDIGLNSIQKHSYGTHEFTFVAKFGDNARRYRWLQRF
jgi:type IX secretion system PorP/SprF family membrane protein